MQGKITFTMIKPRAVSKGYTGPILNMISESGFRICALKMLQLTRNEAEQFYLVHRGKPFYEGLVDFMISGPIVVAVLEKENAVEEYRKLIGSTDPAKAEEGTIRKLYAASVQQNAVHGSDSDENAGAEAGFFFSRSERF
ncbi:MAG: nucleoside-diphosphate kinase [Bacteroidetes bacterium]|nr:MAG: nucleoside-diphosphate kinase [Bacteroidota bacterium]